MKRTASLLVTALLLIPSLVCPAQDNWTDQLQWREVGPTATGGRVTDIAVNPNNPHHILVASAAGGLWETRNNGTTWNCIFEKEATTTIGDVAFDPQNTETIWIGTGESNNQRSSLWGDGIYKSTDGGKSWKNVGLPESHHIGRIIVHPENGDIVYVAALGHLYSANPERGLYKTSDGGETWEKVLYVNPDVGVVDVVLDPNAPDTLLAATYERRRRAWNFDGAGPGSAIYKSTDGGENWKKLTNGLPSGEIGRIGLDIYQGDSKIIYATVSNQNVVARAARNRPPQNEGEEKSQQAKDEEAELAELLGFDAPVSESDEIKTKIGITVEVTDEGVTVKSVERGSAAQQQGIKAGDRILAAGGIPAEQGKAIGSFLRDLKVGDQVELKIDRDKEPQIVKLAVLAAAARRTPAGRPIGGEIYRSEDSGETWKKMNRTPVGGTPAYYYGQIRIDPNDDQRLYVLSVPVYVSSDGGKTFNAAGARSVHVDHHALWINPENSNHLMLGNDGGFHISYDQSKTWDYVFNLPLAQFYAIGADMQKPYHVYGGLQDNGSWGGPSKSSGGVGRQDWYRVGGGDGFYVQVDPNDSNIVISESQFGGISRLNRATGARRSIRPPRTAGAPHRYNWNSPILMSQHDPRVVYFAGNVLFKSFNQGDDWLTISPDLTTNDPEKISGNVPHCTITTIAESRLDKNMLMVGTDDGKVQRTIDGGKTWEDLTDNFPYRPENWWCSRVEFSHKDKDTAFVSFTGYREDDFRPFVFKTKDGGKTWTSIAANLPNAPINVIKQDPVNPNTLYVGTEFSVFFSLNEGEQWSEMTNGLPRVSVQDLMVHPRDNDLIIGTHGRGIYIMDDIQLLQGYSTKEMEKPSHLFAIDDSTTLGRASAGWFSGDRIRVAPAPQRGIPVWYHLKEEVDRDDIKLVILDKAGKEVADLKPESKAGIHRAAFTSVRSSGNQRQRGGRFSRPRGISPGLYRAVLTVNGESQEQSFEVKSP